MRTWEEVEYDRRLCNLIEELMNVKRVLYLTWATNIGLSKVSKKTPFDTIYFSQNHQNWASENTFRDGMRSRSNLSLVFAWWFNIEVNGIKATFCDSFNVAVPSWWGRLETSRDFLVPKQPLFSPYFHLVKSSAI